MTLSKMDRWLNDHGLGHLSKPFNTHALDMDVILSLTNDDMREMEISIGDRKRVLAAIAQHKASLDPVSRDNADSERRQVTVLFCDLVGFTVLADTLDPEDLHNLAQQYMRACQTTITQWGGHVANYMGDGLLAFFGWPQASEAAAARAVLAGAAITSAVSKLKAPDGTPLAARVGIATGLVLIGQKMGDGALQVDSIFGTTPNLASRLEALAGPGEVFCDTDTLRLLPPGRFEPQAQGTQNIKGFKEPVDVWSVSLARGSVADSNTATDQTQQNRETELIGRGGELVDLLEVWGRVVEGKGLQQAHIDGEPGLGKSILTAHLAGYVEKTGNTVITTQCWPYFQNSPMHPFVDELNLRAGVPLGIETEERRKAFKALADRYGIPRSLFIEDLGDLLDLGYTPDENDPDLRQRVWFDALMEVYRLRADDVEALILIEDTHWADPTSRAFLNHVRQVKSTIPVMIATTSRVMEKVDWLMPNDARVTLERLGPHATGRLIEKHLGKDALSEEVTNRIIAASDGVPLFAVELARAVREQQMQTGQDAITIPATLQSVLVTRLDATGSAKSLAQMAACIGRTFSMDMLAALSRKSPEMLNQSIEKLKDTGIISPIDGEGPQSYIFRHALIQEAAYQSQPKAKRRKTHGEIARYMVGKGTDSQLSIANHFTAAQEFKSAVPHWIAAAEVAHRRSAHAVAITLYQKGLTSCAQLPASPARAQYELVLALGLGPLLMARDGYGAESVREVYLQAAALAPDASSEQSFAIHRGQWMYSQMRAEYETAMEHADTMLRLSEEKNSPELAKEAHRAIGATAFIRGNMARAQAMLELSIPTEIYSAQEDAVLQYGDDAGLGAMSYLSSTLWFLGQPDRARQVGEQALRIAERLAHPFSSARTLSFQCFTLHLMDDVAALDEMTAACIEHSDTFGFSFHSGVSRIMRGWSLVRQGNTDEGNVLLKQGMDEYLNSGSQMLVGWYTGLTAEAALVDGNLDRAADLAGRAIASIDASGEDLSASLVHRIMGDIRVAQGQYKSAHSSYLKARDIAMLRGLVPFVARANGALAVMGDGATDGLKDTV